MRYNYYEPVVVNEIESAVAVVFMVIYGIIFTAMAVLTIIGMWKVFQKNKMPGWYAVIPGFNMWMYFELNGIPGWAIFLPGANVAFMALASYRIATKMGKDLFFAIINIFYPFVGLMILGFGKAQPIEEKVDKKAKEKKE